MSVRSPIGEIETAWVMVMVGIVLILDITPWLLVGMGLLDIGWILFRTWLENR